VKPFRHEALLYDGEDEFVAEAAAFVRAGQAAEELGPDGNGVQFADMADVGSNPARIIPAWQEFVATQSAPGVAIRGIGEPIFPERSPDELVECQRHEALLNLAFADAGAFWLICPYDRSSLGEDVIEEAHRSHPHIGHRGHHDGSAGYEGLDAIAAPFARPLPPAPADAAELLVRPDTLRTLRRFVAERGLRFGLDPARCADLVLAVHEVASNSLEHGGGEATMLLWADGPRLVCELSDGGRFDAPLAGRWRPAAGSLRGRGLWIANQLCELVQIRTTAAGSVVRLHMSA